MAAIEAIPVIAPVDLMSASAGAMTVITTGTAGLLTKATELATVVTGVATATMTATGRTGVIGTAITGQFNWTNMAVRSSIATDNHHKLAVAKLSLRPKSRCYWQTSTHSACVSSRMRSGDIRTAAFVEPAAGMTSSNALRDISQ